MLKEGSSVQLIHRPQKDRPNCVALFLTAILLFSGCGSHRIKSEGAVPSNSSGDIPVQEGRLKNDVIVRPLVKAPSYSIETFMGTRTVFGSSIAFDNSAILVSDDESGILNAYAVPLDGSKSSKLTESTLESINVVSWFPNDKRAIVSHDSGGNEISHIFVREENGVLRDLTPHPKARADFYQWRFDGRGFFFGSNKRDPKFMDVYEMNTDDYESKLVFKNDRGLSFGGISRNRRYIALLKSAGTNKLDLHLYDRWKDEMTQINECEGDVKTGPASFGPDSRYFYFLTDKGAEFAYLCRYEMATGKYEEVERSDWEISTTYFSREGTYQVVTYDEDAKLRLEVRETATGSVLNLPKLPEGQISSVSFSRDEKYLAFYLSASRIPRCLYVLDLKTMKVTKLIDPIHPDIDSNYLVDEKVVRFQSFDGLEIPAILYVPYGASSNNKCPAIVWVHGGPGGQSRIGYNPLLQFLVNHGYAILAVNNRGSSGYGKTFFKLDDRRHGADDLDDCVYGRDYLIGTGLVDEKRIAICGGSYGGTMTLAALTFRPEAFAAGVDIFGPANWVRTLKNIPSWWESERKSLYEEMGDPYKDEAYLRSISPLFHAKNIIRPLMVLQGANDPRVLKVESDEIVAAAVANGVPVEYLVFDDEGHGFRKKKNQISGYQQILEFLNEHLGKVN